jgi:hypothetical protein
MCKEGFPVLALSLTATSFDQRECPRGNNSRNNIVGRSGYRGFRHKMNMVSRPRNGLQVIDFSMTWQEAPIQEKFGHM